MPYKSYTLCRSYPYKIHRLSRIVVVNYKIPVPAAAGSTSELNGYLTSNDHRGGGFSRCTMRRPPRPLPYFRTPPTKGDSGTMACGGLGQVLVKRGWSRWCQAGLVSISSISLVGPSVSAEAGFVSRREAGIPSTYTAQHMT